MSRALLEQNCPGIRIEVTTDSDYSVSYVNLRGFSVHTVRFFKAWLESDHLAQDRHASMGTGQVLPEVWALGADAKAPKLQNDVIRRLGWELARNSEPALSHGSHTCDRAGPESEVVQFLAKRAAYEKLKICKNCYAEDYTWQSPFRNKVRAHHERLSRVVHARKRLQAPQSSEFLVSEESPRRLGKHISQAVLSNSQNTARVVPIPRHRYYLRAINSLDT